MIPHSEKGASVIQKKTVKDLRPYMSQISLNTVKTAVVKMEIQN